jgi:hypothetical protein
LFGRSQHFLDHSSRLSPLTARPRLTGPAAVRDNRSHA